MLYSPVQELYDAILLKVSKLFDSLRLYAGWLRYILIFLKKG